MNPDLIGTREDTSPLSGTQREGGGREGGTEGTTRERREERNRNLLRGTERYTVFAFPSVNPARFPELNFRETFPLPLPPLHGIPPLCFTEQRRGNVREERGEGREPSPSLPPCQGEPERGKGGTKEVTR